MICSDMTKQTGTSLEAPMITIVVILLINENIYVWLKKSCCNKGSDFHECVWKYYIGAAVNMYTLINLALLIKVIEIVAASSEAASVRARLRVPFNNTD